MFGEPKPTKEFNLRRHGGPRSGAARARALMRGEPRHAVRLQGSVAGQRGAPLVKPNKWGFWTTRKKNMGVDERVFVNLKILSTCGEGGEVGTRPPKTSD